MVVTHRLSSDVFSAIFELGPSKAKKGRRKKVCDCELYHNGAVSCYRERRNENHNHRHQNHHTLSFSFMCVYYMFMCVYYVCVLCVVCVHIIIIMCVVLLLKKTFCKYYDCIIFDWI